MYAVADYIRSRSAVEQATDPEQIDDVITCDPGEAYELSAQIFLSSVYDRLMRYEAEDMPKLVGGVVESWAVSPDASTLS